MFVFLYMFAIMFTSAASEYITGLQSMMHLSSQQSASLQSLQLSFGTVMRSMRTLYESVTGGHDWGVTADHLREIHTAWLVMFLFYQFFATFAMMNVVTGVFCNGAIEGAQQDHNEVLAAHVASVDMYVKQFRALFKQIDTNHSGTISAQELEQHLEDPAVKAYFLSVDIQPHEAETVFALIDKEIDSDIDLEEFILGCVGLRGNARAVDLARMSHESKIMGNDLKQIQDCVKLCHSRIEGIARALYARRSDQWAPAVHPKTTPRAFPL